MFARTFIMYRSRIGPRSLGLLSSLLVAGALACGGGGGDTPTNPGNPGTPGNPGGTPSPIVTTSVNLQNSAFNPPDIQVSPGATVTFTNLDGINHTVTFDNTSIASIGAYTTGSQTVTMPTATGTYSYHCNFHPTMKGTVAVK
jgi:plastocyanin